MQSTKLVISRRPSKPVSRHIRQKLAQFHLESLENRQLLSTTYYVAPTGSDTAAGSSSAPFKTLQTAVSKLTPGDTLNIRAGTYAGFIIAWDPNGLYGPISGTSSAQITIQADPAATPGSVIINSGNHYTGDAIDFEPGPSYITIQGLTIQGNSSMGHGIRFGQSTGIQILNNTINNVSGFGIFTSHTTDGIIQGNTVSNTKGSGTSGHGIYVSNSAVRPIVRGNILFNNGSEGLHMNGDVSQGGSGVITGAIVEDNIIYNNVANGINCDGVQNSTFQNNLIYNNGNHGITLYRIDGSAGSTNNRIINNTIYQPNSGGAAIKLMDASSGNVVFNNVLVGGFYGTYDLSSDSLTGLVSDYNVEVSEFVNETTGAITSLAQWQATGKDQHSFVATGAQLFLNASSDFHLKTGSLAIDAGTSSLSSKAAPTDDLESKARPQGSNWDIGAFEFNSTPDTTAPVISAIASGNITSTSAVLTWTTNEVADSQVEFGTTTGYGSSSTLNANDVLSHSVTISGLSANTTYHYRVKSTDAAGNPSTSTDFTFTTPAPDLTAPTISNITSSSVTISSATIAWTTNEAADTQVQFGTTTSYGSSTTLDTTLATSHSVSLTGLASSTTYHYRVLSHDASGNLTTSSDGTFTTADLGSGPFTVFSTSTVPGTVNDSDGTATVVGVKFQSDVAGYITGVRFYKGSLNTGTHIGYLWSRTGTLLASGTFTGESASGWQQVTFATPVAINADTTYVAGYYAPNGRYAEDDNVFDTNGIDAGPLHLLASGTDGVNGVYNYGGPGTFPTATFMNANYYVDVVFNTTNVNDTTAPTISAVTSSSLTTTGSTIAWTTNEAADSQVEYGTTTSYGSSTTLNASLVTSHSVALTGLQPGTVYHYRVKSKDAAGNLKTSADFTFITVAPDTTVPTASLAVANITSSGGTTYTFTVTFSDNVAVNVSTLGATDVQVTGPNGFSQTATFVSVNTNTNGTPRTATYRINTPGGTWDLTDNGTYTVAMRASEVADTSGNFVAAGTLGTFSVNISDTTAPTATLSSPNVTSSASTTYNFTVVYSDNIAVNVSTLGSTDIVVTGPNGFSQAATFVSVNNNANGTPRSATYQITAPGGSWDMSDNGLYTVTMVAGQVADTAGNTVAAGTLDTFSATLSDAALPTASLNASGVTTPDTSYTFTVTYSDNVGINVSTIGSTDVMVTGPNGFSQVATFVSVDNNANGTVRTATYHIVPPGGEWDDQDNGTYTVSVVSNEVSDTTGHFVAAGTLGTFFVNDPDTTAPTMSLNALNINSGASTTYTFSVTYNDDVAVDVSTIGSTNILVTGPNGFSQTANLVSINPGTNGVTCTAIYQIIAPGGTWNFDDNGTYTFAMLANEVADTGANFIAAGTFGSFSVSISDSLVPTAILTASNVTSPSTTYAFSVTYADDSAINVSTIGSTDLVVTGPNGFSRMATFVSVNNSSNGASRTAIYRISAPNGAWDLVDNGTYTITMLSSEVADTAGSFVAAGALGTFTVDLSPTQNTATLAKKLVFNQHFITTIAGQQMGDVTVFIRDASGKPVTSDNSMVTISVATGPAGNQLSGTLTVQAVNGSAVFHDLILNKAGVYTFSAVDGALTQAKSIAFSIKADASSAHLEQLQTSGPAIIGKMMTPGPAFRVVDQFGNLVLTDHSKVTLSVLTGPGTLVGPVTATVMGGIARFTRTRLSVVGDYTLQAADSNPDMIIAPQFNASVTAGVTSVAAPLTVAKGYTFGSPITLRTTLKSTAVYTVPFSGTATITDQNDNVIGSATVAASGAIKFVMNNVAPGTYTCKVNFPGDVNHTAATSTTFTLKVNAAPSVAAMAAGPSQFVASQGFSLTTHVVSPAGPSTPATGTVTFMDFGVVIGVVDLDADSSATITIINPSLGAHSYTATYSGDPNLNLSTTATEKFTIVDDNAHGAGGGSGGEQLLRLVQH